MRTLTHLVLGLSLVSLGGCAEQPGKKKEESETKSETKTVDGKTVTKTVTETKTVENK
jgi:hypothetical protein